MCYSTRCCLRRAVAQRNFRQAAVPRCCRRTFPIRRECWCYLDLLLTCLASRSLRTVTTRFPNVARKSEGNLQSIRWEHPYHPEQLVQVETRNLQLRSANNHCCQWC